MIRTVIATCLGVLLAVAVLLGFWAILRWSAPPGISMSQSTETQPTYAQRMVQLGYMHDHATNRWYPYTLIFADNCRLVAGTQADATLRCQTPLNPRLGLPNKDETP